MRAVLATGSDRQASRQAANPLPLLGRLRNGQPARRSDYFEGFIRADARGDQNSRGDHARAADTLPAMHCNVFPGRARRPYRSPTPRAHRADRTAWPPRVGEGETTVSIPICRHASASSGSQSPPRGRGTIDRCPRHGPGIGSNLVRIYFFSIISVKISGKPLACARLILLSRDREGAVIFGVGSIKSTTPSRSWLINSSQLPRERCFFASAKDYIQFAAQGIMAEITVGVRLCPLAPLTRGSNTWSC